MLHPVQAQAGLKNKNKNKARKSDGIGLQSQLLGTRGEGRGRKILSSRALPTLHSKFKVILGHLVKSFLKINFKKG